jgi:hypothetical protein
MALGTCERNKATQVSHNANAPGRYQNCPCGLNGAQTSTTMHGLFELAFPTRGCWCLNPAGRSPWTSRACSYPRHAWHPPLSQLTPCPRPVPDAPKQMQVTSKKLISIISVALGTMLNNKNSNVPQAYFVTHLHSWTQ